MYLVANDIQQREAALRNAKIGGFSDLQDYCDDVKLGEDMHHLLLHLLVLQVDWEQENEFVKK
jgi:hypothetical protein